MNVWEEAILKIIHSGGGEADTQHIYSDLEAGAFLRLTEQDLRETVHGGRPAYQHQVRSHLSNLVQAGHLKKVGRGTYSLTPHGLRRVRGKVL
jgi:restriction endonuclease Mrr